MRILLVHNYYFQPGGEDNVFEAEKALLERMGHEVVTFVEDNARVDGMNPLQAAVNAIWSRETKKKLRKLIEETKPDVAHFHNTFLMISPAAYYACKEAGVPVVQSLHNQRMFCAKATIWRDGQVCTKCARRFFPWSALRYRCYRGSLVYTLPVAAMISFHNLMGTWKRMINVYIVFTKFFREKFIEWGIPSEKLVVKPHFVYPDPGPKSKQGAGDYALFIGRFDEEKGIHILTQAWKAQVSHVPLKIRGGGNLEKEVKKLVRDVPQVELVPRLSRVKLFELIKGARFLVWPSLGWYENFGLVAIEAFACGVPVIASKTGVMAEIVDHGRTGLLFEAGNPEALAEAVAWAWNHPREMQDMGQEARREYEAKYTAERNYEMLMDIYRKAGKSSCKFKV